MTSTVTSTITFPYQRSSGPVLGQFMTAPTHYGAAAQYFSMWAVTGSLDPF